MEILAKNENDNFDITNSLKAIIIGNSSMGKTTFFSRIDSDNYFNFKESTLYCGPISRSYKNVNIKYKNHIFTLCLWRYFCVERFA